MTEFQTIVKNVSENEAWFEINTDIYPSKVVLKASYIFVDKAYLYIDQIERDRYKVFIKSKKNSVSGENLAGEFLNELLNQKLQEEIDRETGRIRELLIAQAFSDVQLFPENDTDGPRESMTYKEDPLDISRLQGTGDK